MHYLHEKTQSQSVAKSNVVLVLVFESDAEASTMLSEQSTESF